MSIILGAVLGLAICAVFYGAIWAILRRAYPTRAPLDVRIVEGTDHRDEAALLDGSISPDEYRRRCHARAVAAQDRIVASLSDDGLRAELRRMFDEQNRGRP